MNSLDFSPEAIKPQLPNNFDSDRVVSPKDCAALLGISLATLRRLWREGRGPKVLRISQSRLGVRLRDLRSYLDACGGAAV
jgi:predicted DNA-binding transcriptional regulator AlpA